MQEMLYAILAKKSVAVSFLENHGVQTSQVLSFIDRHWPRGLTSQGDRDNMPLTPRAKSSIARAIQFAQKSNSPVVTEEHLLIGMIRDEGGGVSSILDAVRHGSDAVSAVDLQWQSLLPGEAA